MSIQTNAALGEREAHPRSPSRRRRAVAAVVAAVALAVAPAGAAAQDDPTADQYDPTAEQIEESVGAGSNGSGGSEGSSGDTASGATADDRVVAGLPFTGSDVGILAAAAIVLGAAGLGLRRLTGSTERG